MSYSGPHNYEESDGDLSDDAGVARDAPVPRKEAASGNVLSLAGLDQATIDQIQALLNQSKKKLPAQPAYKDKHASKRRKVTNSTFGSEPRQPVHTSAVFSRRDEDEIIHSDDRDAGGHWHEHENDDDGYEDEDRDRGVDENGDVDEDGDEDEDDIENSDDGPLIPDSRVEPPTCVKRARRPPTFPMQNPALAMRMPPPADVDLVVTKGLGKGGLLRYRMGIPLDADQRTRNAAALHFYTEAKRLCGHDLSMPFSWYVAHGRAEEMIRRVVDGMNENGHGWTPRLARDVLMNSCQRHVQNARRAENEVRRQSGNPDDKPRRGRPKTGRIAQRPTVRDLVANMKALPESLGKAPRSSPSTPQPKSTDTTTSQNPSGDFGSETARPTTTPVATTAAKQTRGPTAGRSERKATIEPLRSFPSPHPKVIKSAKQHRAQMAPIPSNNTSKRTRHQTESAIVPSSHTPVSMPLSAPPSSQVKLGGHIGQHRNRQSKLRADEQPQHTRISPTSKLITNSNTSMSSGSAVFSEPEVNVHYRAVVNRISTLLSKAFEYDDFLRAVHSAARKSVKGPVPSADMSIWYRRSAGKEAIIYDSDDYNKFVERMDQDDIQLVEGCVVFSLVPAARWEQEYDSAEDIHQREPTPTPLPRPRYRPSRSRQDSTSQPNHQR